MKNNIEQKTLYIYVCDIVSINRQAKEKASLNECVKPVFEVFVSNVLKILFGSIGNYANPPTVKYNFINQHKSCVAI